jgi:hypothetical protein
MPFSQMGFRPLQDGVYLISNDKHRDHTLASIDNSIKAMESGYSLWRVTFHPSDSAYEITHMNSGLVIDLCGGDASPGTNIITFAAHDGPNQRWRIQQLDQGYVTLRSFISSVYSLSFLQRLDPL